MKSILNKLYPPGWESKREIAGYFVVTFAAFMMSLRYPIALGNALDRLYIWRFGEKILDQGAVMRDINDLMAHSMWGFWLLAVYCVVEAVEHYRSFYTGSRSIYTMGRLSSPLELHRRCLAGPVLGLLGSGALTALLVWLYALLYYHKTPEVCLPPRAALDIWRMLV